MSTIHDALKTAQREKQNREGGVLPGGVPLIVSSRATGGTDAGNFSWKNTITMAVASVVIVGAVWVLVKRMRDPNPRAAASVAEVPVPVLMDTTPVLPAPVTRLVPAETRPIAAAEPGSDVAAAFPVRPLDRPPARGPRPLARPVVVAAAREPSDSVRTPPLQSGRLRIAVEQPRAGDVAQLFAAGVAAHRAGDLGAALSAYERVLAVAPNDVDALNNMGVLLASMRELDRAESMLRRAVRLAPRHVGAWNNLGAVLAQRGGGRAPDAIAAFEQALAIDPQHQGARVSLAQQHMAVGGARRARQLLEEVLGSNPAMPEAHYALGQTYEMEQDWAGAVRAYSAFVRVAPPRMAADVARVEQRVRMLSARLR